MAVYTFSKTVNGAKLKVEVTLAGLPANVVSTLGADVFVTFENSLSAENEATLTSIVNAHVPLTTAENLKKYMEGQVMPFVQNLILKFAAENIALGITQAGKTGHVLSMFTKRFPVPSETFQNSLKSAVDTGSLYIALDIIEYIRDNPIEFDGLSPFITDARLLAMKNEIETFLGIALST